MSEPALFERARELAARESGLAVAVTSRADGSFNATLVNAGFVSPISGESVVAFVSRGLRAQARPSPGAAATYRALSIRLGVGHN